MRIKWLNVIKTIIFIPTMYIVIHDIYVIFISHYFTGHLASWSHFGFATFCISLCYTLDFINEFKKESK